MASKTNLSVVIDAGTTKITALAGIKNSEGKMEILGASKLPSKGIKRGVIFNIEEAATSIGQVIDDLAEQVDGKIHKVDIAYAGQPMKIYEYKGTRLTSGDGVVTENDVNELYNEAKELNIEQEFTILHILPQLFVIDDEIVDLSPVGITGRKIEATYKIIAVPQIHIANYERVLNKLDLEPGDVVLSPLAAGEAVLTEDEKELGVILLDMGAGTTKLAIYNEGALVHTAVIPFGGNVVTNDIKEGCSILPKWAEQLKTQYGQALGDFADEQKVVTIPGHSGWEPKEISFKSLAFIIQARMEEIVDSAFFQIEKSGIADDLGSGIVLSGGTSALNNLVSLVKFRTGMDARLAFSVAHPSTKIEGLEHPDFHTVLGLLQMALEKVDPLPKEKKKKPKKKKKEGGISPWLKNVVQGVLDYVDDDDDVAMN
ncbi:MAG TPA: cell division protein FtsA [Tangfeifania sp.]|nr:cell division protein FtsA [Tangfeifania sp.]